MKVLLMAWLWFAAVGLACDGETHSVHKVYFAEPGERVRRIRFTNNGPADVGLTRINLVASSGQVLSVPKRLKLPPRYWYEVILPRGSLLDRVELSAVGDTDQLAVQKTN